MKRTRLRLKTRWEPAVEFRTEVPLRLTQSTELERLKERLLGPLAETADQPQLRQAYRRAANDAASLAWLTPYPLLFLPLLLEEKTDEARRRTEKQKRILKKSGGRKVVA